MLSARDAVAVCALLERRDIRFWVMGGWGVDALFDVESRQHKDLDLLVALGDLPAARDLFLEQGYAQQWTWEESRWVERDGRRLPTAFVLADAEGRELDVHVIDVGQDGSFVQLYDPPWPLPASVEGIAAQGRIAGTAVPCVSRAAQLAMHTGYDLPEAHRHDLARLQEDADSA